MTGSTGREFTEDLALADLSAEASSDMEVT
jgi:hypothetical protein